MSDILDQLNEAALFATNRACTFDGQPDEAGMRDLGYAYGHLHREAFTEIERLRGLLQNLADAADDVGIRHFDTDSMPGSVRRMQDATLAARAALGTADQPALSRAPRSGLMCNGVAYPCALPIRPGSVSIGHGFPPFTGRVCSGSAPQRPDLLHLRPALDRGRPRPL